MAFDPHQPLRDDVRLLGEVLGRVLRHHEGDEIFEQVEQVREAAKRARTLDSELEHIDRLLRDMPIASALTVARAFAHFLTLANIAEQHHRVHRRRDHARNPHGQPQRGSAAETLARLRQAGVPADTLAAAIGSMRVELVFTAHPTEIVRRTLLQKHNRIAQILAFRDRPDLTPDEQEESLADLQREIAAAWQTDEVRRTRVSPARRSAGGTRGVRAEPLGCASAVSARRRPRAHRNLRHGASARRCADTFRIVDWRRSRRQSQHHAGGDATSHVARALAGRRSVSQGHRRAAQRAVALGVARERRASRARRRAHTSRIARCSPKCATASRRRAIWLKRRSRNLRRS